MKPFFSGGGRATPFRGCELCLKPVRYLGDHADCRLFRCEDCALVSTEGVDGRPPKAEAVAPSWQIM